jgi:hypothetical protein
VGITYNTVAGYYVRNGKIVVATCVFQLANKGSSAGAAIIQDNSGNLAGLGTLLGGAIAAVRFQNMASNLVNVIVEQVGSAFYLLGAGAAGTGYGQLSNTDFANNSIIKFSATYILQ